MGRKTALDGQQKGEIIKRFTQESATKLAEEFGVSRSTIYRTAEKGTTGKSMITSARENAAVTPMRTGNMYGEFGITGLSRFGGSVTEDWHRDWKSLSKMVSLVKEMVTHPIVGAILFATEMSIRSAEWTVTPASEEEADINAAIFVDECMHDMSHTWDDHIIQAATMLPYGFSIFEKVFKKREGMDGTVESKFDDGRIGWRKFAFRAQDTLAPGDEWVFDENGGIQGLNQQAPPKWTKVFIPIEKILLYRTTSAKNNPQGLSVLRTSWQPWYYSKNFQEIEGISAERMGGGLPVIYLGDGTSRAGSESDFEYAKKVVRDVRADMCAGA